MKAVRLLLLCLIAFNLHAATFDQVRVYGAGGKSTTNWHGQADVQMVTFEMSHSFSKRTAVGVTIAPMSLWQPRSWFGDLYGDGGQQVQALATNVLVRRTFRPDSSRARFYMEVSSGPMWAEERVPAATSHFNFVSQAGFGFVLRPNSRVPVLAGYRFMHISNGGFAPRNPGLNISALMLGFQFAR